MIANFLKIIFICFLFFSQNVSYSQSFYKNKFSGSTLTNYFSALMYLNKNQSAKALNHFNSSKILKESHKNYLNKYILTLISEGKIKRAIHEIKTTNNKKFSTFYEADLLLVLDNLVKKNYEKSLFYVSLLKKHESNSSTELIIANTLESYLKFFNNNDMSLEQLDNFGNLTTINKAFLSCYAEKNTTELLFENIINSLDGDYSRYIFFYSNYLISQNKLIKAANLVNDLDLLSSSLLVTQTQNWIYQKKIKNIQNIFSCKNPNDLVGEFFFLISNLYSNDENYNKSNLYLNISNFLNPKFKFNLSLLAENYAEEKKFKKVKKILNNFSGKDDVYYWYAIKKEALIILEEEGEKNAFNFINSKFEKIKNPSIKIIFDMGNISKNMKKYDLAINFYSDLLLKLNLGSWNYSEVLYRRGSSYERLGNYEKADADLLKSIDINPNDAYSLNYLAYSWLERNFRIDDAIKMLNIAYKEKPNDPYILDSIGWAYYMVEDFEKAEYFLRQAVQLMPDDPIVNDHYGDILWKLNRKIQANYFWKNVLQIDETEDEMKNNINEKLIFGPKNIS